METFGQHVDAETAWYRESWARSKEERARQAREMLPGWATRRAPLLACATARGFLSNRSAHVVDLGCGPGFQVWKLWHLGFRHVLGIDLSEAQIAVGREAFRVDGTLPEDTLRCVSVQQLVADQPSEFDLATAACFLHHIPDAPSLLNGILHILKPGGWLLAYEPSAFWLANWLPTRSRYDWHTGELLQSGRASPNERYIRPDRLRRQLRQAGFAAVSVYSNAYIWPVTRLASKIPLLRDLGPSLVIEAQRPR